MSAAISAGAALAIGAVATAGAAAYSASASSGAAKSQAQAANNANATQEANFQQIQANEAPWVSTGQQANTALGQFYGLPGASGTGGTPDYNSILANLPGYQFQLQQGTQATQRDLAAQGLLQSGAAGKALTTFGQGLAQNYAGQYTAGLTNLSQLGQAGASGVASAGMNAANQIGSNQIYAGNAAAAGSVNSASAINQGLSGLAGAYGLYSNASNPYFGGTSSGGVDAMTTDFSPGSLFGGARFPSTGFSSTGLN